MKKATQAIISFRKEYYFLSNFFTHWIEWKGRRYKSVEHLFQASKAETDKEHEAIRKAPKPGDAKRMGRRVKLRSNWEQIKVEVMRNALMLKFIDPKLEKRLLRTGNVVLVEGNNWHDNYWGDCFCSTCRPIQGVNMLGALLMELRCKMKK